MGLPGTSDVLTEETQKQPLFQSSSQYILYAIIVVILIPLFKSYNNKDIIIIIS